MHYERAWLTLAGAAVVVAAFWVLVEAFPPVVVAPGAGATMYRYNLWTGRCVWFDGGDSGVVDPDRER